jgi:hypothetical protein
VTSAQHALFETKESKESVSASFPCLEATEERTYGGFTRRSPMMETVVGSRNSNSRWTPFPPSN